MNKIILITLIALVSYILSDCGATQTNFCACVTTTSTACGWCEAPNNPTPCVLDTSTAASDCKAKNGTYGNNATTCTPTGPPTNPPTTPPTTNPPTNPPTVSPTGTPTCTAKSLCDCVRGSYCGWCEALNNANPCVPLQSSTSTGEKDCAAKNGSWYATSAGCTPTGPPTNPPTNPPTSTPTNPPTGPCSYPKFCDCTNSADCGWCESPPTSSGVSGAFCSSKTISTTSNGESYCKYRNGTWFVGTQTNCGAPVPAPGPGPAPGPAPEPNPYPTCSLTSRCDCVANSLCGWCSGSYTSTSAATPTTKDFTFCTPISAQTSTDVSGQTKCTNYNGTYVSGKIDGCTPVSVPPNPNPNPNPVPNTLPPTNPCDPIELCGCCKVSTCGWCEGTYTSGTVSKQYAFCRLTAAASNSDTGDVVCKNYNGTWSSGTVDRCNTVNVTPPKTTIDTSVTLTLTGSGNATISAIITATCQKIYSDLLKIDSSKVTAVVSSTTTNKDGTTTYVIKVSVDNSDNSVKTSDVSTKVTGNAVQSQIQSNGVDVQSASVAINNTPSSSYRTVISIALFALVFLLF